MYTEFCPSCKEDFTFTLPLGIGLKVKCPHCGMITRPCSLCEECNRKCTENLSKYYERNDLNEKMVCTK